MRQQEKAATGFGQSGLGIWKQEPSELEVAASASRGVISRGRFAF